MCFRKKQINYKSLVESSILKWHSNDFFPIKTFFYSIVSSYLKIINIILLFYFMKIVKINKNLLAYRYSLILILFPSRFFANIHSIYQHTV